jgi:hypothetical protein
MRKLVRPWDKVIVMEARHDMELVAKAAGLAEGEVLVFTESHCLPGPNFLAECDKAFEANPSWAGFSGRSTPLTHNCLSRVEAAMYSADIEHAMQHHPWRKVLDQCFVIKKEAYLRCGGVEPQYGHFAEWVLAGRLRAATCVVGYAPDVLIGHWYAGDLPELREFAEDFGAGQVRFAATQYALQERAWFDSPARWENRHSLGRPAAWRMVRLMLRVRALQRGAWQGTQRGRFRQWVRTVLGGRTARLKDQERLARELGEQTERALASGNEECATARYLAFNEAAAELGQLREVCRGRYHDSTFAKVEKRSGKWTPGGHGGVHQVGFYAGSSHLKVPYVWSAPEAALWLPLGSGCYEIVVKWLDLVPLREPGRMRLFVDGRPVPAGDAVIEPGSAIIRVTVSSGGGLWLAWAVAEFHSRGDTRVLGIPLRQVRWRRQPRAVGAPA